MNRKKVVIGILVVLGLAAVVVANLSFKPSSGVEVTTEAIQARNLEAIVTASGTIQPKRSVDVTAEAQGKIVEVAVTEGQEVVAGQYLLQIDPRTLETLVTNRTASLASARSQLEQTRAQIENSEVALQQTRDSLRRQEELWKAGLVPRDQYERAVNDVAMRETDVRVMEQSILTQQERIKQEEANLASANFDLSKGRVASPITGIVTRLEAEVGETAVDVTRSLTGTVLMTIADLSVIETEIQIDETDIPYITIGLAAKVSIDALPNQEFAGHVTEVGNSPMQATGQQRATNFKVVVTIDGAVPGVRPGFTCTAVITTATREGVASIPIQAMTVRELPVDKTGTVVRPETSEATRVDVRRRPAADELPEGQILKEIEGAFTVKDGKAVFVPVRIGIAGERYFEILEGLTTSDRVITGPFASVRALRDGDEVRVSDARPVAVR